MSYGFGIGIVFPESGYNWSCMFKRLGSREVFSLPVIWFWLPFAFADFAEILIAYVFYKKGR